MAGKRGAFGVFVIAISLAFVFAVFLAGFAEAVSFELSSASSTVTTVSINDAVDLYAYEINVNFDGEVSDVAFYDFLAEGGAQTTNDFIINSELVAYESRLDNTRGGVTGSGDLFDITHTEGSVLELGEILLIYSDGTEETFESGGNLEEGNETNETLEEFFPENIEPFTLDRYSFNIKLKQGEKIREEIVINNQLIEPAFFTIVKSVAIDFLALSEESFEIPGEESKEINIDFFAPENAVPDVYTGRLEVISGELSKSVNIILEILELTPLFDVRSAIAKDEIVRGEPIAATIRLNNIGDLEKTDVLLEYFISDFSGEKTKLEEETLGLEKELQIRRTFKIPVIVELGEHIFVVKLTDSAGNVATSANAFTIVEGNYLSPFNENTFVWVFAGVIILGVIALLLVKLRKGRSRIKRAGAKVRISKLKTGRLSAKVKSMSRKNLQYAEKNKKAK